MSISLSHEIELRRVKKNSVLARVAISKPCKCGHKFLRHETHADNHRADYPIQCHTPAQLIQHSVVQHACFPFLNRFLCGVGGEHGAASLLGMAACHTRTEQIGRALAAPALCSRAAASACIPTYFALTKLSLFSLFSLLSTLNSLISLSSALSTESIGKFLCLKTG